MKMNVITNRSNRRTTLSYAPVASIFKVGTRVRANGAVEMPDGTYRTIYNGEIFKINGDRYQLLTRYGVTSWVNEGQLTKI